MGLRSSWNWKSCILHLVKSSCWGGWDILRIEAALLWTQQWYIACRESSDISSSHYHSMHLLITSEHIHPLHLLHSTSASTIIDWPILPVCRLLIQFSKRFYHHGFFLKTQDDSMFPCGRPHSHVWTVCGWGWGHTPLLCQCLFLFSNPSPSVKLCGWVSEGWPFWRQSYKYWWFLAL